MTLQKQDGGIRPILCGEIWRPCFASLTVNTTPIRMETVTFLEVKRTFRSKKRTFRWCGLPTRNWNYQTRNRQLSPNSFDFFYPTTFL
jgi:hypothetical protein